MGVQYGQAPNRGMGAHPLTLGAFSSNPSVGRNAIGGQIGLHNQGMANAAVRPMLDRPNVMNPNMSFPAFGGTVGNPSQVAGLSNLQWSGGEQPTMPRRHCCFQVQSWGFVVHPCTLYTMDTMCSHTSPFLNACEHAMYGHTC